MHILGVLSEVRLRRVRMCGTAALTVLLLGPVIKAQDEPGFPKKTGVAEPGIQRPMTDLKPTAEFAVEGHPDWMAATEDAVWVSSSNVNHVVRLDAKTNKPDVIVTVQKPCSGLTAAFGSLWIPSCGAKNLQRVDARTGMLQATIAAAPADSEGGIAAGAGSVWLVVSNTSELDRIDAKSNAVIARISLPEGSFNPIYADGFVWVASNAKGVLVKVDPATNRMVDETPVGPKPRFLTAGAGSVWVLNQGDGTIARVDTKTGKRVALIAAGIPGTGGEINFGGGSVWATVFGYPITRVDVATNKVVDQWTGKGGDSIRYAHGSVWLTFLMGAKVWRLNLPADSAHGNP
jgi:virginiamycin B lyase